MIFSVPEDATIGATVGTVSATDPDPGDTVSYSFLSGNSAGKFAINGSTGKITVAASLDRDDDESYLLRIRARDTGALTVYARVNVSVTPPLNIGSGEWSVLAYTHIVLDWIVPTSERSAAHLYYLAVPADTGFQINRATAANANRCNWSSPPSTSTPWGDLDESFYLVRCKLGTGAANIQLWKWHTSRTTPPSVALRLGPIQQSWHRADHQVGYRIESTPKPGSPMDSTLMETIIEGTRPGYLPVDYAPDEEAATQAINDAASTWNGDQLYVTFEPVTSSIDTTIRGYWNPGTPDDDGKCGGSIACKYKGSSVYSELAHQPFWIEFPPQFSGDSDYRRWTNDAAMARNHPRIILLSTAGHHA